MITKLKKIWDYIQYTQCKGHGEITLTQYRILKCIRDMGNKE